MSRMPTEHLHDSEVDQEQHDAGTPVLLRPRDPLIFRDARPFAADPGARAFSLRWPMPRTVAGALRTHFMTAMHGKNLVWDKETATGAHRFHVQGPLLVARASVDGAWEPHVHAPADLVPFRETEIVNGVERKRKELAFMCLRPDPLRPGEGCDLPEPDSSDTNGRKAAMSKVELRPMTISDEVKPETDVPAWWSITDAERWLASGETGTDAVHKTLHLEWHGEGDTATEHIAGIHALPEDSRVHVAINPGTLTNVDGALFATESRVFRDAPRPRFASDVEDSLGADYRAKRNMPAVGMLCQVHGEAPPTIEPAFLPLGGERRLTRVEVDSSATWPRPTIEPSDEELGKCHGLRLQLVTPAIFTHGWLPGWMADGTPPGLKGSKIELKLVGAATGRRVPVSGWRLNGRTGIPPGPRKTFYAVPAGSVYFFEFIRGTFTQDIWRALWLSPVSDLEMHRHDGFGLVLPGLW